MIKNIVFSIFIVSLFNILFQVIAYNTGTERSPINLDYFFLLLLLHKGYKKLFYAFGVIVAFFDFMNLFVQIFPFVRLEDLLSILKFALISSFTYQIFSIMLVVAVSINLIIIKKMYHQSVNLYLIIILNLFLLVAFCQKNYFYTNIVGKFWKPYTGELVVSGTINYLSSTKSLFTDSFKFNDNALRKINSDHATKNLIKDAANYNKILLILNESWGVVEDKKLHESIIDPLLKNPKVTKLDEGYLEFSGFTISGELRELCQVVPLHYNLKNQVKGFEDCLPHVLKSKGFKTVGVHGALGSMYDRKYWYPRAGFENIFFRDEGLNLINSRCFSFPGNCDKDITGVIANQFSLYNKTFIYWLTLNTHAIYDLRDLYFDRFKCEEYHYIQNDSQICRNLKLQHQFFYTLSKMIKDHDLKGVKVIVVGDHTPPIISNENNIFKKNIVPFIEFTVD